MFIDMYDWNDIRLGNMKIEENVDEHENSKIEF